MHKIQSVSRFFKWLFIVIAAALPIVMIVFWIRFPVPVSVFAAKHGISISFISTNFTILHSLSFQTKLIGFMISLIPLTINLLVLYFLIRLFDLYERCEIFSPNSVRYIKRIGYTLVIGQCVHPVYELLLSAALTWHNPPGMRVATITFTGSNAGVLLMALMIILVSWVMAEGAALSEEQKYTV